MSKTVFETTKYELTEFYRGSKQGICPQITPLEHTEYVTLTREDVEELVDILIEWLEYFDKKSKLKMFGNYGCNLTRSEGRKKIRKLEEEAKEFSKAWKLFVDC